MADIFVSYAREDEGRIEPLVRALTEHGWTVFWDRNIPAGQTWRTYIGGALAGARCVLVAWSRHSVASGWVSEEADDGRQRGVLVPLLLDAVDVPIGFRSIQAADLTGWQPGADSPRFDRLLADIEAVLAAAPSPAPAGGQGEPLRAVAVPPAARPSPGAGRRRLRLPLLLGIVAVLVAAGGYAVVRHYAPGDEDGEYRLYRNARAGYSLSYPSNLLAPQAESVDGTSRRFVSRDGRALLVATAATGRSAADLGELFERQSRGASADSPMRVVTYRVRRDDWFVVSGYEQSRIWYEKTIAAGGTLASFRLEYDEAQRKIYDPVAAAVSKSFAIGDGAAR
jgi:hypothetical protein